MLLGNQGLVTQVNIKSSGNVVVSPLSTSVSWASTGGLKITSTGFPISGSSTSVDISTGGGWASTGGLKMASTGFPVSQSSAFTISDLTTSTVIGTKIWGGTYSADVTSGGSVVATLETSTGLEGTKLTDGTYTEAISSNSAMRTGIWDYPTAGIVVKAPTGDQIDTTITDGTNTAGLTTSGALKGTLYTTSNASFMTTSATAGFVQDAIYTPKYLTTSGQVKATAGYLHTLTVNNSSAGGNVTIYASATATGTVLGIVGVTTGSPAYSLVYDCYCSCGIYISYTGGIGADLTISYI